MADARTPSTAYYVVILVVCVLVGIVVTALMRLALGESWPVAMTRGATMAATMATIVIISQRWRRRTGSK